MTQSKTLDTGSDGMEDRATARKEVGANFDWPADKTFEFRDEPGEHDPCYVIMPDGAMLPLCHHAKNGVDQARAQFIVDACNEKLARAKGII